MNVSSIQKLCTHLISSAFQRCRLSKDLCRLSVVLESSPTTPMIRVSISDTGIGSCLEEFQDLKYTREGIGTEKWGISDNEIYHYHLNLRESVSARRLTRLPSNPKNDAYSKDPVWVTHGKLTGWKGNFLKCSSTNFLSNLKIFEASEIPWDLMNVAAELVIERGDVLGLQCENVFLTNECSSLRFSTSNVERLKSGLEEYVLKHGNSINIKCDSCFCSRFLSENLYDLLLSYVVIVPGVSNLRLHVFNPLNKYISFPTREQLKIGTGVACSLESHRNSELLMEAVIVISEVSELTTSCFRSCSNKTEVLHFKDFSPCSVSQASLKALTSIDWRNYGLTLGSVVDQGKYKTQPDRHLIRKAVKLALDDLKERHTGFLLSAHAVKICSYAPDLASTIAGLILSSNDSDFQSECISLLGIQSQEIVGEAIEDCIEKKIISVIESNDQKPEKCKEAALFLFEDDCPQGPYFEVYEEGEDVFSSPD
ncbi:hypothetical protein POUND7_015388 [Theobroma cacao]